VFDSAQHGSVERGLVLLQIEGHVLVTRASQQRTHEVLTDEHREQDVRADPHTGNRAGCESRRLHHVRADQQRHHERAEDDRGAPERELEAPACAHAANDTKQRFVGRCDLDRAGHRRSPA
jgi:hypothetical protein